MNPSDLAEMLNQNQSYKPMETHQHHWDSITRLCACGDRYEPTPATTAMTAKSDANVEGKQ